MTDVSAFAEAELQVDRARIKRPRPSKRYGGMISVRSTPARQGETGAERVTVCSFAAGGSKIVESTTEAVVGAKS